MGPIHLLRDDARIARRSGIGPIGADRRITRRSRQARVDRSASVGFEIVRRWRWRTRSCPLRAENSPCARFSLSGTGVMCWKKRPSYCPSAEGRSRNGCPCPRSRHAHTCGAPARLSIRRCRRRASRTRRRSGRRELWEPGDVLSAAAHPQVLPPYKPQSFAPFSDSPFRIPAGLAPFPSPADGDPLAATYRLTNGRSKDMYSRRPRSRSPTRRPRKNTGRPIARIG